MKIHPGPRMFGTSGIKKNGLIHTAVEKAGEALSPPGEFGRGGEVERPKSASTEGGASLKEGETLMPPLEQHSHSMSSLRDTTDQGTQTVMMKAVTSVEYLNARSTQTESPDPSSTITRKSLYTPSDFEEREALLMLIDDALDETIDRNSRSRTNHLIAKSAKRQAEIWRDAKEFITCVLLPQSIKLANTSRRRRQTAAEIVSNIKIFP